MPKHIVILLCIFTGFCNTASADTTWLNKKWQPSAKDTASYFSLTIKENILWRRQLFYAASGKLYSEGDFLDNLCISKTGQFKWFSEDGNVITASIYANNKPLSISHFHSNGKIKTLLLYDTSGKTKYVNSWDESGRESFLDTFYHDRRGKECHGDTAFSKGIISKSDSTWQLRFFTIANDQLFINSFYKERLCRTRTKYFIRYHDGFVMDSIIYNKNNKKEIEWHYKKGGIRDIVINYDSGKKMNYLYFHNNGQKNYYKEYDSSGNVVMVKNWDEAGVETATDSLVKFPKPATDMNDWKKKLIKKINSNQAFDRKQKKDFYGTVYIGFIVDIDGNVDSALINQRSTFPEMDSMILSICKLEQSWKPGTRHGRRESFYMKYYFSFVAGKLVDYKPYFL